MNHVHQPLLAHTLPDWRQAVARRMAARLRLPRSVWHVRCEEAVDRYLGAPGERTRLRQVDAGRYSLAVTEPRGK